jgi:hypothetical protein
MLQKPCYIVLNLGLPGEMRDRNCDNDSVCIYKGTRAMRNKCEDHQETTANIENNIINVVIGDDTLKYFINVNTFTYEVF